MAVRGGSRERARCALAVHAYWNYDRADFTVNARPRLDPVDPWVTDDEYDACDDFE